MTTTTMEGFDQEYNDNMAKEYYCLKCQALIPMECFCNDDIDEDDDNWQPCDDCDLPDACCDFGCAIEAGLRSPNLF